MNIRQQKYKKNRIKGMNKYNAARAAGYSHTYSLQACRIERLENVRMVDYFEQAGFTDKAIVDFALEAMRNATKLCGESLTEHPDWPARHKFFESILKLTGKLKEDLRVEHSGIPGTTIHIHPAKAYIFRDCGSPDATEGTESNRLEQAV